MLKSWVFSVETLMYGIQCLISTKKHLGKIKATKWVKICQNCLVLLFKILLEFSVQSRGRNSNKIKKQITQRKPPSKICLQLVVMEFMGHDKTPLHTVNRLSR